jgi:predicted RecB family nuclease
MTTAHMTSQKYKKIYHFLKYEKARYELNKRYKIPTTVTKKITIVCNETVMSW